MVEKKRYPQIPSTVWWGVRTILQKSPKATIDERLLGAQLDVQEAAAKQYLVELRAVGILTEDGKATPVANKWRLDDSYEEAVEEIVAGVYPEALVHWAPPGDGERQKIISWFEREGLGRGAAGNKAASYLLIGSPNPNDAPARGASRDKNEKAKPPAKRVRQVKPSSAVEGKESLAGKGGSRLRPSYENPMPLNVNVQIHISADAGSEQIESIFAAMRRYLHDASDS